ncbi:MAG: hypothetical protein HY903_23085 [Deltaproteobacteria bacterium]|nr:hypothetical protein [Deltaproteobacteria bacterium]
MSEYIIQTPHTKEECLAALDETAKEGRDVLNKFEWGCMSGDHTGYGIVEAPNKAAALNLVPSSIRNKATVREVRRFTPEDIQSFHQG